jgi:hypothetical protein
MVLPVAILRGNGQEKQLAYTLDVTETSARLGGLRMLLETGEVIEVQRGGRKAKFEVYWMGAPGTELEGQAGVRGVDPMKSIWSIHLPPDEPDIAVDALHLRQGSGRRAAASPEQIETARYECSAGVTLRAPGSNYPFRAQIKSIHLGGLEVECITTLPLSTVVEVEMRIEGILVETTGVVTVSTHRVGMEIGFHKPSPEVQRKVVQALQKLKQKAWDEQPVPQPIALVVEPGLPDRAGVAQFGIAEPADFVQCEVEAPVLNTDPLQELAGLARKISAEFDYWQSTRPEEMEELRRAVAELNELLSPAPSHPILKESWSAASSGCE